jgi:hypothetical protein
LGQYGSGIPYERGLISYFVKGSLDSFVLISFTAGKEPQP